MSDTNDDRRLVERCVKGESAAWDELYDRYHDGLLASIRMVFRFRIADYDFLEEIAARVWYTLCDNHAELLNRYDPSRGCRLTTYLATIAKGQAMRFFRTERRRRDRERIASRTESVRKVEFDDFSRVEFSDFVTNLTPRERDFFYEFLLAPVDEQQATDIADTSRWKLSSRIQAKMRAYLGARFG